VGGTLGVTGNASLSNNLTVGGTLSVAGGISFTGDLDLATHQVTNVTALSNTSVSKLVLDKTTPQITAFVGTGSSPIVDITSSGLTINGNLNVVGSTTHTTIESSSVQVNDINVILGYSTDNGALLDGGGLTLGTSATGPTFLYKNSWGYTSSGAWAVNVPLLYKGSSTTSEISTGTLRVYDNADFTKGVEVTKDGLVLSSKWRIVLNSDNTLSFDYNSGSGYTSQWKLVPTV
jgi:hypothetical protein